MPGAGKPFKTGEINNPDGPPTGKRKPRWRAMLERAIIADEENLPEAKQRLRLAAESLLNKAAEGDIVAIREIGDRIDGKSAQQLPEGVDASKVQPVVINAGDAQVL